MSLMQSAYPDGEAYPNPFHAMLELGADWAETGMSPEDMIAASHELSGEPRRQIDKRNLESFAQEFVERTHRNGIKEQQSPGDYLGEALNHEEQGTQTARKVAERACYMSGLRPPFEDHPFKELVTVAQDMITNDPRITEGEQ